MIRASSFFVGVALLAACQQSDGPTAPFSPSVPLAAAVTHSSDRVFFTNDLVVQNQCSGEDILLHLRQMFVIHELTIEGKAFHGHFTFMDRGTRGEGLTSGATYRQVGAEQEFFHAKGDVAVSRRIENTLDLIGQGKAPNAKIHEIFRLTVTPAGEVRLEFDKVRQVCRG
jgi:hypothetical protein